MRNWFLSLLLIALLPILPFSPAASASPAVTLKDDWRAYVLAPPDRQVEPVAVLATVGGVTNAEGALLPGGGTARLARTADVEAILDLDFGQVVSGRLEVGFAGASNPPPGVRVAFSETRQYLGERSDFSRSDFAGGPGTDNLVPPPAGGVWIDHAGCQVGERVCAEGIRAFRYARIFLGVAPGDEGAAAPSGWVDIDYVRLNFTPFLGTPDTYKGWFLSSDDRLNRIWYASVYTNELTTERFDRDDVDPRGAWSPSLDGRTVLHDGAKRDRAPYVGDLAVQGLTELVSHADAAPVATLLADLADHQRPDGYIPPSPIQHYTLTLFDYPAWWVIALHDYTLYTGDLTLAGRYLPHLTRLIDGWYPSVTNERGLVEKGLATNTAGWGDYAFLPRDGEVTYYNANYVRALRAAADLAASLGALDQAAAWRARAGHVAAAIDAYLWDARASAYLDATNGPRLHPQDGNAIAILARVPRAGRADAALDYLDRVASRPWGNAFVDDDVWFGGASGRVYPFISYPEVQARFATGRDTSAVDQIRRTWGWMLDRDPGSTFWEATGAGGDIANSGGAYASMAHGWSTGAAPALTNNVLGVTPTAPGFARYDLIPRPGGLAWAQGRVPTPRGPVDAAWDRDAAGDRFTLRLVAPAGTSGRIGVPTFGQPVTITLDGRVVWEHGRAIAPGVSTDGRYVYLENLPPGAHTVESRRAGAGALDRHCFSATGRCVEGRFLAYWRANGGLAINGYPLSDELTETLEDGRVYTVQYFERTRLEYHPENDPPYDVLLGQFGRRIRAADPPAPQQPGAAYFPATGHNLAGDFLTYWQANGGLAQFGFPISEEFEQQLENGRVYRVQYFERARFEHHPENDPPYDILLGQFGRRILDEGRRR